MNPGLLQPQGPVAAAERLMLIDATTIMLSVIVPVILLVLGFAWWFRAGNGAATRRPEWAYSGQIELTVWSIPILVVVFLAGIAWIGSHRLDPIRPIDATRSPFEVEVVALDWKWLFIYPSLGGASVNRLVVPAGVPVRLRLTSASVMNSFLVPQLGGQIYAMAGMVTTLHVKADRPGRYPGLSAQFSGDGFSDMRFETVALDHSEFNAWQTSMRASTATLDASRYAALAAPGTAVSEAAFGSVVPGLFDRIVATSAGRPAAPVAAALAASAARPAP